ncbi:MAG TPA: hypothetical protein PLD46_08065 [Hyphomicrobium sp.]|nr:hypothetical protein [Hyphomicrobium sp.]
MDIATQSAKIFPRIPARYFLLLPVAAAIVHLVATFIAMSDTRGSAYYRLDGALPVNTMQVLQPILPAHQPLPFLSSDARYAICRFSSAKGPVDVSAQLPDRGWTLGVYHPDGTTAYFAAGSLSRPTKVAITILAGDDRFVGSSQQTSGLTGQTVPQLTVAAREGLIVVRAPDRGQAYRQSEAAVLALAKCTGRAF